MHDLRPMNSTKDKNLSSQVDYMEIQSANEMLAHALALQHVKASHLVHGEKPCIFIMQANIMISSYNGENSNSP